jgi:hypothetical protein
MAKITDYRGKVKIDYNRGKLNNFKEVFGSDPWMAFIPVIPKQQLHAHLELMHNALLRERTEIANNRNEVNNV